MADSLNRRLCTVAALAAVAAAAFAGGRAEAATTTVGSSLTGLGPGGLTADQTLANSALPAPAVAVSPIDGTVITWRYVGSGGPFTLRVVRANGATTYTGAGTSAPQTSPGFGLKGPFPTSLPIRKGDLIGINGSNGSQLGFLAGPGRSLLQWIPQLLDQDPGRAPTANTSLEVGVDAIVRYCVVPKLKGKTPKAARAALEAADCTVGKVKKTKKKRKKKKVLSQSDAPGSSISDTEPIDLKISRKKKA